MPLDLKSVLVKVAPQHLAKGIERGLVELDSIIVGSPVQPSLAGNVAMTLVGVAGAMVAPAPFDEVLAIMGGHHSTTLWDYLEAAIGGGGTASLALPRGRLAPKMIPGVLMPKYMQGNGNPMSLAQKAALAGGTYPGAYCPERPGLVATVGARQAINVGPYAGGITAPSFTPGVLRPKYLHGA